MAPLGAGAMLLAGGMAQAQDTLVIIEHSSSLLTATFDGVDIGAFDIANTSSDHWTINIPELPPNVTVTGTDTFWHEGTALSGAPLDNLVHANGNSTITVVSDLGGPVPDHNNGDTDTTSFFIGTAHLNVTFTDDGDSVPDAAATLSLLSLSLAGLGILRKSSIVKTKGIKKMNPGRIIWMAPVAAGAMLLGGSAFGSGADVDELVITEHSSSLLTATFNGNDIPAADIVNNRFNKWTITLPSSTAISGSAIWAEPEQGPGNQVEASADDIVSVLSELFEVNILNDNGATDKTSFKIGTAPLWVTFTDNGDVPDAAATLSLLSLSLAGLGVLRKTFSIF
jgi:hypothetical protein